MQTRSYYTIYDIVSYRDKQWNSHTKNLTDLANRHYIIREDRFVHFLASTTILLLPEYARNNVLLSMLTNMMIPAWQQKISGADSIAHAAFTIKAHKNAHVRSENHVFITEGE